MALRAIVAALLLAAAAAFAALSGSPPAPVPASAPPTEFSAERAMLELAAIATRPHPTGTPAADAVRARIAARLGELGLEVEGLDTTAVTEAYAKRWGAPVVAAHVRDVVARVRGTEPGPGLLLSAHYDSRELAPGASDDGYGTVVLLETARALASSPPLRHDVWLLFTEGEEQGLLGMQAFLDESPHAADTALALNFEARGDRGPAQMFQTSPGAAGLVEVLGRAAPDVAATSLSQEVYRRMPNDTDLSPWLRAGRPGMNVANVEGFARYHQATDTVANADARTVQHQGSYALALARAFADRDPVAPPAAGEAVYFSLAGRLVRYPAREALTLAAFATGLLAIAAVVGVLRRRVRAAAVAGGSLVALAAVVVAALVGQGAWWAVDRASGGALAMQTAREGVRATCVAGMVLLGAGVAAAGLAWAARRMQAAHLALGALLPWAALALASATALPGGSWLFAWPLLAAGAAWCAAVASSGRGHERAGVLERHVVLLAVPCAVAIVLVAPLAVQLGVVFGPAVAPAVAAIGANLATTAVPLLARGRGWRAGLLPGGLVAAAAACLVGAAVARPFDAAYPRPDSLLYAVDAEGHAWWLSFDEAPDEWTRAALGAGERASSSPFFPRSDRAVLRAPAPAAAAVGHPTVTVVSERLAQSAHTLHLHVALPPGTELAGIDVPAAAHVSSATVQGRAFSPEPDGWIEVAFFGPPAEGLDLTLAAAPDAPVRVLVLAQTRGLPADATAAARLGPRPPDRMPEVGRNALHASDMTLAAASFDF